jgi:ABC-type multidrug transport system ATPase subunit
MMPDHAAVRLLDVTKTFDGKTVLEAVNLSVAPGEICGIMGRNGSGKTTLLRIICGLVRPGSGQVTVLGENGSIPRGRGRYHRASRLSAPIHGEAES